MDSLSPAVKKLIEAVAFGVSAVAVAFGAQVTAGAVDYSALVQVFLAAAAGKFTHTQAVLK